jgi:hypothetical protein
MWQSVQPNVPWTLAACLAESIEMLLPLAEVIPAWPWQARQLSSCLSGWGDFGWAPARVGISVETNKSKTK